MPLRLALRGIAFATSLLGPLAASAYAVDATAEVRDRSGSVLGTVELTATPSGTMLIVAMLRNVPEGTHGIHIHETGDCSADDFSSAGGHLTGGREHGLMVEGGPHSGDLPNAHVTADGLLGVEVFNPYLTLSGDGEAAIFDADGSAFIVHADPDDYETQPSGNAGDRIACGVFRRTGG